MKKADFIVIGLVLLLAIGFYSIYFTKNLQMKESSNYAVEIYYDNTLVYDTKLDEDINQKVKITSKDKLLHIEVDENNDGIYEIKIVPKKISSNQEILNIVHIEYDHIHMEEANCKNKLCMNMRIGKNPMVQIICTNDIIVKLVSKDDLVPWIPVG
jgi:hypothetical protein